MIPIKEGTYFAGLYFDEDMDPDERPILGEILFVDKGRKVAYFDLLSLSSYRNSLLPSISWPFRTFRKCSIHKITKDQYECIKDIVVNYGKEK